PPDPPPRFGSFRQAAARRPQQARRAARGGAGTPAARAPRSPMTMRSRSPPAPGLRGKSPSPPPPRKESCSGQSAGAFVVNSGLAGAGVNGAGVGRSTRPSGGGAASCATATPSTIVVSTTPAVPAGLPAPPAATRPES